MVPKDKSKMITADLAKQITAVLTKLQALRSRFLYLFKNISNFIKALRFIFSFRRKQTTSAALLNAAFKVSDD